MVVNQGVVTVIVGRTHEAESTDSFLSAGRSTDHMPRVRTSRSGLALAPFKSVRVDT